jgi:hypothetical protein
MRVAFVASEQHESLVDLLCELYVSCVKTLFRKWLGAAQRIARQVALLSRDGPRCAAPSPALPRFAGEGARPHRGLQ